MPNIRSRHLSLLLACALLAACGDKAKQPATPDAPPVAPPTAQVVPAPQAPAVIPDPQAEAAEKARQAHLAAEVAKKAEVDAKAKAQAEAQAKALAEAKAAALQAWKQKAQAAALAEWNLAVKKAAEDQPAAIRDARAPWTALRQEFEDTLKTNIAESKARVDALNARRVELSAARAKTRDRKEQTRLQGLAIANDQAFDKASRAATEAHALWLTDWKARQQALGSEQAAAQAVEAAYPIKLKAIDQAFKDRQAAINAAMQPE